MLIHDQNHPLAFTRQISMIPPPMPTTPVQDVFIIFKLHLDVGFSESAAKVRHDYINWQIFNAISHNRELQKEDLSYKWTLPSWVIWEALDRHTGKQLQEVEKGIREGALTWHALPFTTHTEYIDESLFEFGISLSQRLDQRFGVKTIAAKMTDVPGHTQAMIPSLARAGVKFLHVGVNWACPQPEVPELFIWKAPTGEEIMVLYSRSYSADHQHPQIPSYLAFRMFGDNMEIASCVEARQWVADMRKKFPGANVRFARLDDYATTLMPLWPTLPVVTQEIGDTWIYGVGSDPWKTKKFRALSRKRKEWLQGGKLLPESKTYIDFSKNLLLVGEHTWSIAHIAMLAEEGASLNNAEFDRIRHRGLYKTLEASCLEQRDYLEKAVDALQGTDIHAEAEHILQSAEEWPRKAAPTELTIGQTGPFQFEVSPSQPGLSSLKIQGLGDELKAPEYPLFSLGYQTFSQSDYDRFYREYVKAGTTPENAPDFGKVGLGESGALGQFWKPSLQNRTMTSGKSKCVLHESLTFPEEACVAYGAPKESFVRIEFQRRGCIDLTLGWRKKRATRRPEAIWFHCGLALPEAENWRVTKLGMEIPFSGIVSKGGRKLHATDWGTLWRQPGHELWLESTDAALVSPGKPVLGIFDDVEESPKTGLHFLLWDNFWGTNFPAWYDEDATFHFRLTVTKPKLRH